MKRVKVMLLAIAVVAIAAGTLAFKAHHSINYCTVAAVPTGTTFTCQTTIPGQAQPTCSVLLLNRKTLSLSAAGGTLFCTTAPITDEFNQITCPNTTACTLTRIDVE